MRLAVIRSTLMLVIGVMIALNGLGAQIALAQIELPVTANAQTLRMRGAPNNRAAIIAELPFGAEIRLTGRDSASNWGFGTAPSVGKQGWVALNFVSFPATPPLSALPVVDTVVSPDGASSPSGGNPPAPTQAATGGSAPAAPPPPVVAGSISGGFELGGQVTSLNPRALDAMRRAGMNWVKLQAREGDGSAGAVGGAHSQGFKILFSVIGNVSLVTDPGYQDQYAAYVGGLAAAGADAIEVWNEQNIDREWPRGQIDPGIYVQLLAKAYNAIKAANRNTIVITGAPAPTGAEGAFGTDRVWNDDRYTRGMAAAGAARYADCVGVHYNEGIVSPNQRSGDPRGDNYPTRYFDTMLARGLSGFGGKKACFTELGYLSGEGYGGLPGGFAWASNVSVQQHAAWLAQAAVRASNSGRVRLMIVFNVDFTYFGEDPQAGFAIIRADGSCPACDALASVRR